MSNDWTKSVYYSIDPLQDVAPSLLNSSDIVRYANKGCLVHPFDPGTDLERLNPATYTIRLLGNLHLWEQEDRKRCPYIRPIAEGDRVTIPANSITYLETEEEFRLPQYIAARFNLHIRYVHMGILLGTGPLVDPGFVGPLLIPLHNLTDNDYEVEGGDNLLWVEFTKLTTHRYWHRPVVKRDDPPPRDLIVFRGKKLNLNARSYLLKAEVWNRGVISAFKGALADSRKQAKISRRASEAASREALAAASKTEKLTVLGALGIGAGVVALLLAAWQLWYSSEELVSRVQERLDRVEPATTLPSPQDATPTPSLVDRPSAESGSNLSEDDYDEDVAFGPDDDHIAEAGATQSGRSAE